jgi:hypothetical protein
MQFFFPRQVAFVSIVTISAYMYCYNSASNYCIGDYWCPGRARRLLVMIYI